MIKTLLGNGFTPSIIIPIVLGFFCSQIALCPVTTEPFTHVYDTINH